MSGAGVQKIGLQLVSKPVQRVGELELVREGTSGRVILPRVWAVGEEVRPFAVASAVGEGLVRPRPELAFYRKYTEALLRRYMRLSMANGRVPSLLGRELFRGKVTNYTVTGFDDVVIFCLDIERCVGKLQSVEQALIRRIAVQEYSQGEAAGAMGLSLRDVVRKYGQALDRLTGLLLAGGLMEPIKSCQGGKEVAVGVSC